MPVVNLNIPIPAGLAPGQTAAASQILTLYNTFNAMNLPDTIGVFQQAFVDDVLYTLTVGGTVTKDWTLTTVTQLKSMIFMIPFNWSSGNAPTLKYRVNGSDVTATQATTNAGTGTGMLLGWIGGRDADTPRPIIVIQMDSGGTNRFAFANADLALADMTSFGITLGGTAGTFNFKHVRFWREG